MNAETDVCLESVLPLPRPAATNSTLRVAGRGSPGRCLPGGAAIPPPEEQPAWLPKPPAERAHSQSLRECVVVYAPEESSPQLRRSTPRFVGLARQRSVPRSVASAHPQSVPRLVPPSAPAESP